jgi:F420-0:gamma-glutamyl ligase
VLVTPVQVAAVRPNAITLLDLIDGAITQLPEGSILVVTSKVVSLCEGRVVPLGDATRDELIAQEADYYLPTSMSNYGHHFTLKDNTIVGSAGIDESNGDGHYVLWPRDSQKTANTVRQHVRERFGLERVGVLITDSISQPLRLGSIGAALAFSGFAPLHEYAGEPDIFQREFRVSRSSVVSGLAAAATVAMGEGSERTPLCILSELPFVTFQAADPTPQELQAIHVPLEDDLFAPFLQSAPWQRGGTEPKL